MNQPIFNAANLLKLIAEISETVVSDYEKQGEVQDLIRVHAIGILCKLAPFSEDVVVYEDRDSIQLYFGKGKSEGIDIARIQVFVKVRGLADLRIYRIDGTSKEFEDVPVKAVLYIVKPELEKMLQ